MVEKAKTPRSGAEREAKYEMKMKDYEAWSAKNREKKKKFIDNMSEQKREEMKRKDRERKRQKREAEKLNRPGLEYKTRAALGKAKTKALQSCILSFLLHG